MISQVLELQKKLFQNVKQIVNKFLFWQTRLCIPVTTMQKPSYSVLSLSPRYTKAECKGCTYAYI